MQKVSGKKTRIAYKVLFGANYSILRRIITSFKKCILNFLISYTHSFVLILYLLNGICSPLHWNTIFWFCWRHGPWPHTGNSFLSGHSISHNICKNEGNQRGLTVSRGSYFVRHANNLMCANILYRNALTPLCQYFWM